MSQAAFDLEEGLIRKNAGISRVGQNNRVWLEAMRRFAKLQSRANGHVTSDDLRAYCDALSSAGHAGFYPTHPNAWGTIFHGKGWKVVGRTKSTLVSNHGREIRQWRYIGEG